MPTTIRRPRKRLDFWGTVRIMMWVRWVLFRLRWLRFKHRWQGRPPT